MNCASAKANLHSNVVNSELLVVKVEVFYLTTLPQGLPEESKEKPELLYLVWLQSFEPGSAGINVSNTNADGFGGLVVSMLASGSRVRGFDPERSRWIFSDVKKSSACLPSAGK
jgi:hypothetical protein